MMLKQLARTAKPVYIFDSSYLLLIVAHILFTTRSFAKDIITSECGDIILFVRSFLHLKKEYLLAAIIIFVGLVLRTYTLASQSVWSDEYISVAYLNADSWSEFRAEFQQHSPDMPPLYYAMLFCWARLVGTNAVPLRLLSILLGAASLWLMWCLGRSLFGSSTALIALALFAFSPQQIYHAQEIRCYPLVILMGLLSALSFLRMLRGGGDIWWITNAAVNALLFWTHLATALLAMTWALGILIWLRRQHKKIVVWGIVHFLAIVPLAAIFILAAKYKIAAVGVQTAVPSVTVSLLIALAVLFFRDTAYVLHALPSDFAIGNGLVTKYEYASGIFLTGTAFTLALLFFVITVYSIRLFVSRILMDWRIRRTSPMLDIGTDLHLNTPEDHKADSLDFLLLWFLVPATLLLAPILFVNLSAVTPRYSVFVSPALYLITALGLDRMGTMKTRTRILGAGILVCMLIMGVSATLLPIRGNYLAVGRLIGTNYDGSPIAVLGDSPFLGSLIAYNDGPPEKNFMQMYSPDQISSWLRERVTASKRGWFVLEDTHSLENTEMFHTVENLIAKGNVKCSRHFFNGPQILIAYNIFVIQGQTTN